MVQAGPGSVIHVLKEIYISSPGYQRSQSVEFRSVCSLFMVKLEIKFKCKKTL